MIRKAVVAFIVAVPVCLAWAASNDFFDTNFDGIWTGVVKIGGNNFPIVINIDTAGSAGVGFAMIPNTFNGSPTSYEVASLGKVKVKGKKLTFDVDTGEFDDSADAAVHSLTLKLKKGNSILAGKFKSTGAKSGKATLYPSDEGSRLQQVWVGAAKINGEQKLAVLQVLQADTGEARAADDISGFGIVGDVFGSIKNAMLVNNNFTGSVTGAGDVVEFDVSLNGKSNQLKGNFTGTGFSVNSTLTPPPTSGKPIKVSKVSPSKLEAGSTTTVTVKGKNLAPGLVPHFDQGARATNVEFVSKKSVKIQVFVPDNVDDGAKISMRFIHADNQQAEKKEAFNVEGNGGGGTTVSLANDVQPIFNESCAFAGCHGGGAPAQGLDLTSGRTFSNTVNVASRQVPSLDRIEPGDPDSSYLIQKIRGTAAVGGRMPLNQPPLSNAEIQTIVTWAMEGGNNN